MTYKDIEEFVRKFMDKYINNHWEKILEILKSKK